MKIDTDSMTVVRKSHEELRSQIRFLSKTGHSAPQAVALPRKGRQRRITYGQCTWKAS